MKTSVVGDGAHVGTARLASIIPKLNDPGHRALRHAARAAVAMSGGFFVGHFLFHNGQVAILAAFSAAALLGMADFTGDRPQRILATSVTLAVGVPLVVLGTAVSLHTLVATVVMFSVAFIIAFGAVFSGYFAAGANAAIVFFVVATGLPGPDSSIPSRLGGLALGGGLSILASGWLWPTRAVSSSLETLSTVYRDLADAVRQLAQDEPIDDPGRRTALEQVVLNAELAVAASAWRPGGLTRAHKSRMYLLHGARRMATLLQQIQPLAPDTSTEFRTARQHMLLVQADTLRACGDALTSNGAVCPDEAAAETAKRDFEDYAAHELQSRIAATTGRQGIDHDVAELLMTLELARITTLAALQTRIVFGVRPQHDVTVPNAVLVTAMTVGVPSPRKWWRRARRNLTFHSVHLRNSLRLATALAVARAAVGVVDLKHGFWVIFATLVVVKTSAAGTRTTALGAAAGTGLGFVVSSALLVAFGIHVAVYCVALPFLIFAAFYLPLAASFLLGQACFTMVVVFLFNILVPTGWSVGLLRFEDVLIGSAIGFVVGAVMWPRGASTELASALADLVDAGNAVASSLVQSLLNGEPVLCDASDRWLPAVIAATTAEDVFSQFLAEMHVPPAPVLEWSTLMSAGHQLWYGAAIVGGLRVPTEAAQKTPKLQALITEEATVMRRDYEHLAETLRTGIPLLIEHPPPLGSPIYAGHPQTTFRLLEVQSWVREQMASLDGLQAALRATVLPQPALPPE